MVVLLFIATVAACIFVDYIYRTRRSGGIAPAALERTELSRAALPALAGLRAPEGLYYHPGHAWMAVEDTDRVRLGVDDFANRLVGAVDDIEPPEVGRTVRQGAPIWSFVRNGRKVSMVSPVDGVVDEVNPRALRSPEAARDDPYNEGWIARIKVAELDRNARNLLHGPVVGHWLEDAMYRLQSRFSADLGTVMADGGVPCDDFGSLLSDVDWAAVCGQHFMSEPTS